MAENSGNIRQLYEDKTRIYPKVKLECITDNQGNNILTEENIKNLLSLLNTGGTLYLSGLDNSGLQQTYTGKFLLGASGSLVFQVIEGDIPREIPIISDGTFNKSLINNASNSDSGLMTASDFKKLGAITLGANADATRNNLGNLVLKTELASTESALNNSINGVQTTLRAELAADKSALEGAIAAVDSDLDSYKQEAGNSYITSTTTVTAANGQSQSIFANGSQSAVNITINYLGIKE